MDCCDLRLTFGQLARHIQTCPFNVGLWHKCTRFCGDTAGTTVPCSVWLSDERLDWGFWPYFWTDDGHLVLNPVEYIRVLISPYISSIEYEVFHKKYALINIITLFTIIFHNFHQKPTIFKPFPYIPLFFLSRFSVSPPPRWPLCIDPQGQANRWIKKHAMSWMSWGPGHGTVFFCSEWDLIHYIIYIFSKGSNFFSNLQVTNVQDVSKLPEFGWEHLQLKPLCVEVS